MNYQDNLKIFILKRNGVDKINQITILNMIIRTTIIPSGVALRVIIILIKMIYEDETTAYKKKIQNTIIFGVIAELIYVIYDILRYYYA